MKKEIQEALETAEDDYLPLYFFQMVIKENNDKKILKVVNNPHYNGYICVKSFNKPISKIFCPKLNDFNNESS